MENDPFDRAIIASIPVLVKARPPDGSGRRMVEVEASTEEVDADGDIVMQGALLDSAANFVAKGHLDLEHYSELGDRLGIPDPASYIVGRPIEVKAMPYRRTFVTGEISKSMDGTVDPVRNRYDSFWASLDRDPPVKWLASIYGFPGRDLEDCRAGGCSVPGATRFIIRSIDWLSLAFTRTPKNTGVKGAARIVTAKAFLHDMVLAKAAELHGPPTSSLLAVPQTMDDVYARADCLGCRVQDTPSLSGYRQHFQKCVGMNPGMADLAAHATMYRRNMDGVLKRHMRTAA